MSNVNLYYYSPFAIHLAGYLRIPQCHLFGNIRGINSARDLSLRFHSPTPLWGEPFLVLPLKMLTY